MNSGEFARLAGVTVRTLRHYHQIGLLPEPSRSANGYRDYRAEHLLRLLRIRRATSAGVPLERVRDLLEAPNEPGSIDLLEPLEQELEGQIARLVAQRDVVRRMRSGTFDPSLSSELVPLRNRVRDLGLDSGVLELEADQAMLLAHIAGSQVTTYLQVATEMLIAADVMPAVIEISARFAQIDENTSADHVRELVRSAIGVLTPVLHELRGGPAAPAVSGPLRTLLLGHRDTRLNPSQQRVLNDVEDGLRAFAESARGADHRPRRPSEDVGSA